MKCFHHTDLDGHAAGFLVLAYQKKLGVSFDYKVDFKGINYPDNFPYDFFDEGEDVILVDISFSINTVEQITNIAKRAGKVIWIDHHASSVEMLKKYIMPSNVYYFVSDAACGAALTYIFFHSFHSIEGYESAKLNMIEEDKNNYGTFRINYKGLTTWKTIELPYWLKLVDDYDCWKKHFPETDDFELGSDSYYLMPDSNYWPKITTETTEPSAFMLKLINQGKIIHKYIDHRYKRELSSSYECIFEGITTLCINGRGNSWVFQDNADKYDMLCLWNFNGHVYKYSLYSEKDHIDCSKVAEKYGGGGHPGASGFSSKKLLFKPIDLNLERKVFLGGTTPDPKDIDWRTSFVKELDDMNIKYFNPIVKDWNKEAQDNEYREKAQDLIQLYIITPQIKGVFSIAEAVESANNHLGFTVFCVVDNYGSHGEKFTDGELRSLNNVKRVLESNGSHTICCDPKDLASTLQSCVDEYDVLLKRKEEQIKERSK